MIKKIVLLFGLLLLAGSLIGCDSAKLKQDFQRGYDKYNPNGDRGICLYLGRIKNYPYTTKYMEKEINDDIPFLSNIEFKERLAGFAEIGMFTREKVSEDHGEDIYRYSLTDLGHQYLKPEGFCFGKIIVTGVKTSDTITDSIGRVMKTAQLSTEIENIPDWVNDNLDKLSTTIGVNMHDIVPNGGTSILMTQTSKGWSKQGQLGWIRYGYYLASPED
ncbi:hypothetical protein [Orbus mooreae]|uniref:hypothetical protein n=1 Tax=Orbus mooreae TaxID=3074107 RepID=UPI00370D5138